MDIEDFENVVKYNSRLKELLTKRSPTLRKTILSHLENRPHYLEDFLRCVFKQCRASSQEAQRAHLWLHSVVTNPQLIAKLRCSPPLLHAYEETRAHLMRQQRYAPLAQNLMKLALSRMLKKAKDNRANTFAPQESGLVFVDDSEDSDTIEDGEQEESVNSIDEEVTLDSDDEDNGNEQDAMAENSVIGDMDLGVFDGSSNEEFGEDKSQESLSENGAFGGESTEDEEDPFPSANETDDSDDDVEPRSENEEEASDNNETDS